MTEKKDKSVPPSELKDPDVMTIFEIIKGGPVITAVQKTQALLMTKPVLLLESAIKLIMQVAHLAVTIQIIVGSPSL